METIIPMLMFCIVFWTIPVLIIGRNIFEEKKNGYKIGCSNIIGILLMIPLFILAPISFVMEAITDDSTDNVVADGFTIEGYEMILDVGLDNKVDVTEIIDINFYEAGHHGIYKFTPRWLKYTDKNGNTISRKSNVLDYRAEGDAYILDVVKKKDRIKIGNANATVFGDKRYTIKYTYDMGKDPYKNFDEFIFHTFGDYWGTQIKNPKITINMPKSIEGYNVNFFTDKYRKENVNDYAKYNVNGNTLTMEYDNNKPLYKSLTIDIELPEGYFEGGSYNYGYISLIISIVIFILTFVVAYKWYKYGKDLEKKIPTVEFYAPDNLDSAEIGYIFNNRQTNKKLAISLIVELASKGYIKIDEVKDVKGKRTNIQITKLKNRATSPKSVEEKIPQRQLELIKLKEVDDKLSDKARYLMIGIFENYKIKLVKDITKIELLSEMKDELVNNGYIKIVSDYDYESITDESEKKELYRKQLEQYNADINELNKDLIELSSLEKHVYDRLFEVKDQFLLNEHNTFYKVFKEVSDELNNEFNKKIHDEESYKKQIETIIITILITIMSVISYWVIEDMDPNLRMVYYLAFCCIPINILFILIMTRKTNYGETISARVKGFRNFLLTAEKEQLEEQVQKYPNYFYDILPYAYVLGISKKWIKKFEDIPMPNVDMGSFDYSSSFSSLYSDVSFPEISSGHSSSSSGCSSCGGGCSSCGGGCSSCGGGGSW